MCPGNMKQLGRDVDSGSPVAELSPNVDLILLETVLQLRFVIVRGSLRVHPAR